MLEWVAEPATFPCLRMRASDCPPQVGGESWPQREESAGGGRATCTDLPFIPAPSDLDKRRKGLAPLMPPPPLQPTSTASGPETSGGDGLALGGSP